MNEKCRLCRELFDSGDAAGLETKLAGSEETAAQHLSQCEECAGVYQALCGLDQTLLSQPAAEVPPKLLAQVIEAAAREPYAKKAAARTVSAQQLTKRDILPGLIVLMAAVCAGLFVLNPGEERSQSSSIQAILEGQFGALVFTLLLVSGVAGFIIQTRKGLRGLSPFSLQGGLVSLALLLLMVRTDRNMVSNSQRVLEEAMTSKPDSGESFSEANYNDQSVRGPANTMAHAASQAADDLGDVLGGLFSQSASTAFSKIGSSVSVHARPLVVPPPVKQNGNEFQVADLLPPGHRASTIKVDRQGAVEGYSAPGSHVDVLLTYKDQQDGKVKTRVAIEDAVVVSAGGATSADSVGGKAGAAGEGRGENENGKVGADHGTAVTLALPTQDALKLAQIQQLGETSLVLRAPGDVRSAGNITVTASDSSQSNKAPRQTNRRPNGRVQYRGQDGAIHDAEIFGDELIENGEDRAENERQVLIEDLLGKAKSEESDAKQRDVAKRKEQGLKYDSDKPVSVADSFYDKIAGSREDVDANRDESRLKNSLEDHRKQAEEVAAARSAALKAEIDRLTAMQGGEKEKAAPASGPATPPQKPSEIEPQKKIREESTKVEAKLLSGVNAPVDGTGYPVVIPDSSARLVTKGLKFLDPNGYWENTYVPGDPSIRSLNTQLDSQAGNFPSLNADGKRLHELAEQILQPFDAPKDAAIGVYLNADRKGIEGESRLLLQVGLKGIQRASGHRAALNSAIVADLRGNPGIEVKRMIRAVISAFAQHKESSDKIRLYLLSDRGLSQVQPDDFRLGYLSVELDKQFEAAPQASPSQAGMTAALREAVDAVAQTDDPNAPLGSSTAVIITSRSLSAELANLTSIARQSAIAGVPVSVIGVGPQAVKAESEAVALAGQGARREVLEASLADKAVDQELAAAGNVVARAIRLQIKLAPGVKLVEVLGSNKLDKERSAQVKEAEESIDLRVAKSLGISADRGDDEEGIQIVIPSFYAGDSHVILLDVVAPGAGPVATVNAKFKDLVFLKNGAAQSSLNLANSEQGAGPLELNVLKNMLALRLSTTLEQAGQALGAGASGEAAALISSYERLLQAAADRTIGLSRDNEIAADLTLVQNFLQAISRPELNAANGRKFIADSLTVAGRRKINRIQSEQ